MDLQSLLEPRSVAIVGASAEPRKIPGMIVGFLAAGGYTGRVYPINPRYDRIGQLACYPSIDALPETVDLVVCVVPVAVAFEAIEAAAHRGVPFCLLMTGGFGEGRTGAQGEARRQRLLEICERTGMQVVGPNTVGMVNFRAGLPLTFADWYARDTGCRGGVAIVTHSGSVGGLVFSTLQSNGIGVDYWFGLGNEATLETADFIAHFTADAAIHTVICYIEGVRNGRAFMRAADEARRRGKRIVALRAGGHRESARSTRAHTGKLPSAFDVYAGIFRQHGVIDVVSAAELSYAMVLLTSAGARLGRRVGIISASGGACSLLADHVIDAGLELPELSLPLQQTLDRAIPEYGSSLNPVDLSADVISRAEILYGALAALRDDSSIDVWLVFGRPIVDRYYPALIEFAQASGKAVIVSCGVALERQVHEALRAGGIAVLEDPELCLRALGRIQRAAGASDASGVKAQTDEALLNSRLRENDVTDVASAQAGAQGKHNDLEIRVRGNHGRVHASIENDRDFGSILALRKVGANRRVVRALPASTPDLRDAVPELAAGDRALGSSTDRIVARLQEWIAASPAGVEASVDLCLAP
jgi:acyl-CoA synthetase (NDP forming)